MTKLEVTHRRTCHLVLEVNERATRRVIFYAFQRSLHADVQVTIYSVRKRLLNPSFFAYSASLFIVELLGLALLRTLLIYLHFIHIQKLVEKYIPFETLHSLISDIKL